MITQNPIVGRSRKKLAGVYARTLWGKNIIQSCPTPSSTPPTQALQDSRSAFGLIMQMANMIPTPLLYNLYYAAPVGRSRRHVLSSQLFNGVQRSNKIITYDFAGIKRIGTNPIVTNQGLLYTASHKNFEIPIDTFPAINAADTSRVPCVLAISYDLGLCVSWFGYTSIEGDDLIFRNISDTFMDSEVLLLALWQVNIGTIQNPIWVFGSFASES